MKSKIFLIFTIFMLITTSGLAGTSAKILYNKAEKLYLQDNHEKAIEYCNKLVKKFKTSSLKNNATLLAGLAYLKLARYAKAREYFNKVLLGKPSSFLKEDAYLGLADSYFLEKNYNKARQLYNEMLVLFPKTGLTGIVNSRLRKMGKTKEISSIKPLFYTVQLGSFKRRNNAKRLYRKFKKRGYSAYIIESEENGRPFYRVRVGKFKTETQARTFAKKLKKQGYETKISAW